MEKGTIDLMRDKLQGFSSRWIGFKCDVDQQVVQRFRNSKNINFESGFKIYEFLVKEQGLKGVDEK